MLAVTGFGPKVASWFAAQLLRLMAWVGGVCQLVIDDWQPAWLCPTEQHSWYNKGLNKALVNLTPFFSLPLPPSRPSLSLSSPYFPSYLFPFLP